MKEMEGGSNSNPSSAAWSAPQLPTDQKIRRMKLYWRAALISNFVLGGQHPPPKKQLQYYYPSFLRSRYLFLYVLAYKCTSTLLLNLLCEMVIAGIYEDALC